jgi:elongation factor Ts
VTVPAQLVKQLREQTGAGMMDCKRALEDTGGDLDAAQKLLREKGVAAAGKRAERETNEGKVLLHIDQDHAAIVAVGSETDPVAQNEEFLAFARKALDVVEAKGPDALEELEPERLQLVARIGENIAIRGARRLEAENGEVLAGYVHPPAEKIGVLVRARASAELARLVAMHISFADPRYLTRDEVPAAEVESERAIYEKLPDVASKPEEIRGKIVEGMLQKRLYAESVLAEQPWIHDDSKSVGEALDEHGAEVHEFVRYSLTSK